MMTFRSVVCSCLGLASPIVMSMVAVVGLAGEETSADRVDFARQILPILSDKCFVCHGPDAHEDTDLRLDSWEAATEERGGYRALDPDQLDESEILSRIHSADDPMPPRDAEKSLSDAERELLTKWIHQGGQYAIHWALAPPSQARSFATVSEAIDEQILSVLRSKGLELAPEADRSTLARRVALVLTGLPPEPDQLDAFLADPSPHAYERLVDQLLASPRYGEHQARYWLDAVRYGDTHGLHLDNRRGIYPYRDWVVRAFNENLPLDEFIRWQLAGDLIPDATLEQRLATGFVRLNPSTGEGGAIPEEFQMKNNFDRVETLGTVFLGLSLTCARCHTHKYDPIEQTDYYRLLAFFNSTAEPSMDGNSYTYGPVVRAPADQPAWERWRQLQESAERVLRQSQSDKPLDIDAALAYSKRCASWSMTDWQASELLSLEQADAFRVASASRKWSPIPKLPGSISGRDARGRIPGPGQLVWVSVKVSVPEHQSIDVSFAGAVHSRLHVDGANVPWIEKSEPGDSSNSATSGVIDLQPGTHDLQFAIVGDSELSSLTIEIANRWDRLAATNDWPSCRSAEKLMMLADPQGPLFGRPLVDGKEGLAREAAELAAAMAAEEAQFTTSLVAEELPVPRPTYLLRRGEYDLSVGDPLVPATPKVLGGWSSELPPNRLGLAQWLTSRDHPLVARVLVNRIWQRVFGQGLVRTPEDFGLQGQQPTHPELLDWLAVALHDSDWNLKRLIRAMVTSRTFRQSSKWREDIDDPENRLFARASSHRLDAEVLRDIGLWTSGLLDPHMGGEGIKPYQPAGMWAALAHPASNTKNYERDHGPLLYRRSLYVYWKRTSPHPMMTLFDAPDRESSCVRRSRTNTPLQSLGMLNETQRIEIGRSLAIRLLHDESDETRRVHRLFRMLACRDAVEHELDACRGLLESLRQRYREAPDDAAALLAIGDAPRDDSLGVEEFAAWSQLATTVLASDIAIMMY